MNKNKVLTTSVIAGMLFAFAAALLVNYNLEKNYKPGEYVKAENAYFVEKIEDPTGLIKAQKFVTPTDNKYNTQKTRSIGTALVGDIESVWDSYTGAGTTIAIIDDGFDYQHPEFLRSDGTSAILSTSRYYYASGNNALYQNYATNPNVIGQDWEYNGYDAYDWSTHGTATSTTAAAPMNNGGGVGIAPEAHILALKIDFTFVAIKAAMEYAIAQGVDVINMSLGAYAENFTDGFGVSQVGDSSTATYLNSVCLQAYNAGVIVVAAAGNEATYRKSYPASNTKVIGVGALGDYDNKGNANALAEFTNYVSASQTGEINVDILAPGYVYTAHQMGTQTIPTHTYADTQGTSFSSPIIAGAAALWKEKYPNGTPTQFLNQLQASADGIGFYTNKMVPVSGWDPARNDVGPSNITNGRLNVANLLDINDPHVTTVQSSLNLSVGEKRQINLATSNGTISYSSSNAAIASVTNSGLVEGLSAGNATITVTATKGELTATATVEITVSSPVAISSMAFNPPSKTLNVGDTYNAEETLSVSPSNASRIFLFESANEGVATVDIDTGMVTAVGVGSTTIDAISVYGDGSAELTINVENVVSKTGTLNFGNASGRLNVDDVNVSGKDNLSNSWSITTTGTTSFTPSADYSQIGSSKYPASSIQFAMTLSSSVNFTSASASFGGNSGSSAIVTIKVGTTTIGTGSVVASTDTTTTSNTTASGTSLVISLTNIAKGIKAYSITYTYTGGSGGGTPTPTLTSVTATNNKTYRVGETILKSDITVNLNYSDGSSTPTIDFTFPSDGYRFTYDDTNSGGSTKAKQFSVTYNSQSYSFSVNVSRASYTAPSGATTTLSSSQFSSSTLSKSSGTPSSSSVTIGGLGFTVSTNAYVYQASSVSYLSFGKNTGSIQNTNMTTSDLTSVTVSQKSDARQDGTLTISQNGSMWVAYSVNEVAKGGYRFFKYAYLTNSTASGALGYSNIQSISFTLSGSDNPTNVAHFIMFEDTTNQCTTKFYLAIDKLNTMSSADKEAFWTSADYAISTARERLLAWARHEGKTLTYSDGAYRVIGSGNIPSLLDLNQSSPSILVVVIAMLGLASFGGYLFLRIKKEH